jgi:hypothetical protein
MLAAGALGEAAAGGADEAVPRATAAVAGTGAKRRAARRRVGMAVATGACRDEDDFAQDMDDLLRISKILSRISTGH